MKYYFLALGFALPAVTFAHDGSLHTNEAWYQLVSLPVLVAITAVALVVIGVGYQYRLGLLKSACAGLLVLAVGFTGTYYFATQPAPVTAEVMEELQGVQMTLFRTPDCGCCNMYAEELKQTGAVVTVETISSQEMGELKKTHGISRNQESCHTTVIGDYVVEGHVPFEALAKLLAEQPAINGLALPGMPIGTPGMPGRQTEVYKVQALSGELFWQSS